MASEGNVKKMKQGVGKGTGKASTHVQPSNSPSSSQAVQGQATFTLTSSQAVQGKGTSTATSSQAAQGQATSTPTSSHTVHGQTGHKYPIHMKWKFLIMRFQLSFYTTS